MASSPRQHSGIPSSPSLSLPLGILILVNILPDLVQDELEAGQQVAALDHVVLVILAHCPVGIVDFDPAIERVEDPTLSCAGRQVPPYLATGGDVAIGGREHFDHEV